MLIVLQVLFLNGCIEDWSYPTINSVIGEDWCWKGQILSLIWYGDRSKGSKVIRIIVDSVNFGIIPMELTHYCPSLRGEMKDWLWSVENLELCILMETYRATVWDSQRVLRNPDPKVYPPYTRLLLWLSTIVAHAHFGCQLWSTVSHNDNKRSVRP